MYLSSVKVGMIVVALDLRFPGSPSWVRITFQIDNRAE
jgi:hypothetical protein